MASKSHIVVEAIEWWRDKRPEHFTAEDHLDNPTINCISDKEKALAKTVAEYLDDRE